MTEQNFKISKEDPCLNIRERDGNKMFLVLYVDDGIVVPSDKEELNSFLHDLKHLIPLTNCQSTMFVFSVMSFSCSSSVVGFIRSNLYLASRVGSSRGERPLLLVAFVQGMEDSWQGDVSIVVERGCSGVVSRE
jgi:hypothetical protein